MIRVKGDLGIKVGTVHGRVRKSLNDAAKEASEELAQMVIDNISRGYLGLPWGDDTWPPLSESYAKKIGVEDAGDHPGLIDTGALRNSVKTIQHGDGKYEVVVEDPKAVIHEYGMGNNPKRPFFRPACFAFSESGAADDIVEEHLSGAFDE
jgi:hypothetical protein